MFKLLGQVSAKVMLDSRILDLEINPLFYKMVLG